MSGRPVAIKIRINIEPFLRSTRSFARAMRQAERNRATRPLSAERHEVIAIGQREMTCAVDWFARQIATTPTTTEGHDHD